MNKITVILTSDTAGNWLVQHEGSSAYYHTDWDYPALAQALGWGLSQVQSEAVKEIAERSGEPLACVHVGTDGTVDCPDCGVTDSQFIEAAAEWLGDNEGEVEIPESAYDSIAWCHPDGD